MPVNAPAVVLIGGGPRTAGLLERLAANRELLGGKLQVHVVEPHTPGAGRIWRYEQPAGLMLNSAAADVTMFTDASVQCEGPAVEGPGLAEWAAGVLDGSITDVPELPQDLRRQLASLTGSTFPTRQLQSVYLEWFFRRAVAALGPDTTVTVHRDTASAVEPVRDESGQEKQAQDGPAQDGPEQHGLNRAGNQTRDATASGWPAAPSCPPTSSLPPWGTRTLCRTGSLPHGPGSPPGTARSTQRPATLPTSTTHRSPPART